MCTLTWWRDEGSAQSVYGVFFNRDEKKDRPVAEPPREMVENEVRFLSPRDPRGGGTWMLVNEYGVVVCLLNKWHVNGSGTRSRGKLVLGLAGIREAKVVGEFLQELADYPPFSLFVMDGVSELVWEWDGQTLSERDARMPMTSSSYCFEEVKEAREARFAEGLRGGDYHAAVGEEPSAFTVRMCRPDAQTWSRSKVSIGEDIEWDYLAEVPDLDGEPERMVVSLCRC